MLPSRSRRLARAVACSVIAVVVLFGAIACSGQAGAGASSAGGSTTTIEDTGATTALAQLATLAVKGRAPMTGYSRDEFGPAWKDVDHNGCDTRNDILNRDLTRNRAAGRFDVHRGERLAERSVHG